MRTLLVEDDPLIGEAVCQALRQAAFAVDWVTDGEVALSALGTQDYAILILDLGLPRKDGLDVLQQVRKLGNAVPILIITARSALDDRILGLDLGADDYLMKPFHVGELLARVRALTRRQGGQAAPVLQNGSLTLNPATHEVSFRGEHCQLSAREFAVLRELLLRPGVILSRSELEERIYGWNEEVESNAIDFLIHAIRKKVDASIIKNVRGVGWMTPKLE